jgi:hypothetical protein
MGANLGSGRQVTGWKKPSGNPDGWVGRFIGQGMALEIGVQILFLSVYEYMLPVLKIETRIKETRMSAKCHNDPRYLNPCLYRFSP